MIFQNKVKNQRTTTQNRALHLLFKKIAKELNDAGLDMRAVLKPTVEIPWGTESIKTFLWKPVQKLQLGKESTTELTTQEIDRVYETLNRFLGEKHGIHVAFPSEEEMLAELKEKDLSPPRQEN